MGLSASPIPLTAYDASSDSAITIYEVPQNISKASYLLPLLGTALNSQVIYNRSGLQNSIAALERPELVAYLAALFTATTVGLSILTPGVANLAVSAAGTTQGGATAITTDLSMITTAAANSGVVLLAITPLDVFTIINNGANALKVYPAVGDYIGSAAVNVAVSIAVGGRATFYAKSTAVANTVTAIWQQL